MMFRASRMFACAVIVALASLAAPAQTITTRISVTSGGYVQGIAANYVTNKIYASINTFTSNDALAVIDGSTDTLQATIAIPLGARQLAVNIVTNRIYIATCDSSCSVTVVDGNSRAVVASIPIANSSDLSGIAVDPLTNTVYVADDSSDAIDIIDAHKKRNVMTGSISLNGQAPTGIAFNPIYRLLYVTYGTNQVSIVDPSTQSIVGTSTVGVSTYNAATNWLSGHVFVTDINYSASAADVLSDTGTLLAQVPTDHGAYGVDVDPITNLAFVANGDYGSVTAINGSTNTAVTTVSVSPIPEYIAVNPVTEKVYAAGSDTVTVLTEQ